MEVKVIKVKNGVPTIVEINGKRYILESPYKGKKK